MKELEQLEAQVKAAERDLAEARGELELVRRRFAYVADSPEARETIGEAETKVENLTARLEELKAAHDRAVKKLEEARRRANRKVEREKAEAKRNLPRLARSFHEARCELLTTMPTVVEAIAEAIKPLEDAVDRYYAAGEAYSEALAKAGELTTRASGWPFRWADLKDPAQALWRHVLSEVETPKVEIPEKREELIQWLMRLLGTVKRLGGKFPPAIMPIAERKRLEEEARAGLKRLAAWANRERKPVTVGR